MATSMPVPLYLDKKDVVFNSQKELETIMQDIKKDVGSKLMTSSKNVMIDSIIRD